MFCIVCVHITYFQTIKLAMFLSDLLVTDSLQLQLAVPESDMLQLKLDCSAGVDMTTMDCSTGENMTNMQGNVVTMVSW